MGFIANNIGTSMWLVVRVKEYGLKRILPEPRRPLCENKSSGWIPKKFPTGIVINAPSAKPSFGSA